MNKKMLLTGGTGLIGRNLIKKLSPTHDITVITRDPARATRLLGDDVSTAKLSDISTVEDVDIIINLAGEPIADRRWTQAQKTRICDSRWDITQQLATLINAAGNKPDCFISGSAIGIYGRQGNTVVDESFTDYHQEFTHEVCQTWEDKALEASGTRVCLLRTGIVLAENGGALAKMLMPFRMGLGGKVSSGKQFMSWIHIDDMTNAIIHLIDNVSCSGAFNMTSPNPHTNHFFSLALAKRLERPLFFTIPAAVLKLAMGESSDLLLYGQKVVPSNLEASGFTFTHPVLKDALETLDL